MTLLYRSWGALVRPVRSVPHRTSRCNGLEFMLLRVAPRKRVPQ